MGDFICFWIFFNIRNGRALNVFQDTKKVDFLIKKNPWIEGNKEYFLRNSMRNLILYNFLLIHFLCITTSLL
jgi:hypothetical protein